MPSDLGKSWSPFISAAGTLCWLSWQDFSCLCPLYHVLSSKILTGWCLSNPLESLDLGRIFTQQYNTAQMDFLKPMTRTGGRRGNDIWKHPENTLNSSSSFCTPKTPLEKTEWDQSMQDSTGDHLMHDLDWFSRLFHLMLFPEAEASCFSEHAIMVASRR